MIGTTERLLQGIRAGDHLLGRVHRTLVQSRLLIADSDGLLAARAAYAAEARRWAPPSNP